MDAGGIDWPLGVNNHYEIYSFSQSMKFVEWGIPTWRALCRKYRRSSRSGADGLSVVRIIYMLNIQTARPLLVGMGSRAQGCVFLSYPGKAFH